MRARQTLDAPEALVLTMVLVAAADGGMTDREIGVMAGQVQTLPAFQDFTTEQLQEVTDAAVSLLNEEDGLQHAARLIRGALNRRLRETAYALACEVIAADEVASQDRWQMLEFVQSELDLDPLVAAAIERGVRATLPAGGERQLSGRHQRLPLPLWEAIGGRGRSGLFHEPMFSPDRPLPPNPLPQGEGEFLRASPAPSATDRRQCAPSRLPLACPPRRSSPWLSWRCLAGRRCGPALVAIAATLAVAVSVRRAVAPRPGAAGRRAAPGRRRHARRRCRSPTPDAAFDAGAAAGDRAADPPRRHPRRADWSSCAAPIPRSWNGCPIR